MFIQEVIGAGEVAIADERASEPTGHELARLAHSVHLAGMLSGKSGVVHVHVGDGESRLKILREAVEKYAVQPEWIYATHISRSEKLMLEAIELAKGGSFVDIDTADDGLAECIDFYMEHTGWEEKLTVSSDASVTSPHNLFDQIRCCIVEHRIPLETILPLVTSNPATVLKLEKKGRLGDGMDGDALVLTKDGFELREVISRGRRLVKNGELSFAEKFLNDSNRRIILEGRKWNGNGNGNGNGSHSRFGKRKLLVPAEPACEGK